MQAIDSPIDSDDLIVTAMGLVGHIVRETMNRVPAHVSRDDLHSAGLTAVVKAARAFEADRGVPFARYAASRIRGAMLDELRGFDWASRSVRRRARDLDATRSRLTAVLGRTAENRGQTRAGGVEVAGPAAYRPGRPVESPQLVEHRASDPAGGVACERHAAVGLEGAGRLDHGCQPGGVQIVSAHMGRYAVHRFANDMSDQTHGGHDQIVGIDR